MTIIVLSAQEAARKQEYFDLGDREGMSPYEQAEEQILDAIDRLHSELCEIQALKTHAHEWDSESDYCVHCGADGRA